MAPQEIRRALIEKPFMPFRLHLSDGSRYEVLDPADAYADMLYVMVGVDPDETGFFRKAIRISPTHVTKIEPMPELKAS